MLNNFTADQETTEFAITLPVLVSPCSQSYEASTQQTATENRIFTRCYTELMQLNDIGIRHYVSVKKAIDREGRTKDTDRSSLRRSLTSRYSVAKTIRHERITRKLSYRKDDRAMHPIYGYPENFRESLITPTVIFPEICNGLLFRSIV